MITRPIRGIVFEGPALPPIASSADDALSLAIERALDTLPPRPRRVAELRLRAQRPTAEIAAELRVRPATVDRYLRQMISVLRRRLPPMLRPAPLALPAE